MRRTAVALAVVAAVLVWPLVAIAGDHKAISPNSNRPLTMAVIGDTPYGEAQVLAFPSLVADVNADKKVALTLHVGDIKNGSSLCTDEYFALIRGYFDSFEDPFVLTPGDNEWTDCHRANNGGYQPLERLAELRSVFFPEPGATIGGREKAVLSQADEPGLGEFVENRLWLQSRTAFGVVHVVGSNNDLQPWFGAAETPAQTVLRLAEYQARLAATLAWLDETFEVAEKHNARAVVLGMQADTWVAANGFVEVVGHIAELAADFEKPVLLLQGDTHDFLVDKPLENGSTLHGVTTKAPNLTRVVVEGETTSEWLRLTIDPRTPEIFSWERVFLP
jgi:hypothetical protein